MILYAAILKMEDLDKDAEILEEHIAYLNKHIEEGSIFAKGPFTDHSGGLVIFNTESIEKAKELMDKDPVIVHNTRTYIMKEWKSTLEK